VGIDTTHASIAARGRGAKADRLPGVVGACVCEADREPSSGRELVWMMDGCISLSSDLAGWLGR
jgi:hypothetical protein